MGETKRFLGSHLLQQIAAHTRAGPQPQACKKPTLRLLGLSRDAVQVGQGNRRTLARLMRQHEIATAVRQNDRRFICLDPIFPAGQDQVTLRGQGRL